MNTRLPPRKFAHFLAVGVLLALSACTTAIRQHPEFADRRQAIRSVGVIPPDVTVKLVTFTGEDTPIPESEKHVEQHLPALVAAELASRGFTVPDAASVAARLDELPDLRFQTTQLRQNFAQAESEMFRTAQMSKTQAESYRRSLGAQVSRVSDPLEADALVLVRVQGFEKSGGEIAADMAKSIVVGVLTGVVTVQPTSGASMSVAFVDGRTGDVLWANTTGAQGNVKGTLPTLVKQAFAPFPTPATSTPATTVAAAAPAGETIAAATNGAAPQSVEEEAPVMRSASSLASSATRMRPMPGTH